MIEIILSIWDLGGQERFDFMKAEYLKGCAAIALCFDLSREDSFNRLDYYLDETRKNAGNIPILLTGNKSDLEDELGEMISSEDVKEWMRNNQITDYIKCSAKTGFNVESVFKKLSMMALIDLRDPVRIGEFRSDGIFRFKMVLVGAGGVGKTSLTQRYAQGVFKEDYKLTVGVDFITRDTQVDEDLLPEETLERIGNLKEKEVSFARAKVRRDEPVIVDTEGMIETKSEVSLPMEDDFDEEIEQISAKTQEFIPIIEEKLKDRIDSTDKSKESKEELMGLLKGDITGSSERPSITPGAPRPSAGSTAPPPAPPSIKAPSGPPKGPPGSAGAPPPPGGAPPPAGGAGPESPNTLRGSMMEELGDLFSKRKMDSEPPSPRKPSPPEKASIATPPMPAPDITTATTSTSISEPKKTTTSIPTPSISSQKDTKIIMDDSRIISAEEKKKKAPMKESEKSKQKDDRDRKAKKKAKPSAKGGAKAFAADIDRRLEKTPDETMDTGLELETSEESLGGLIDDLKKEVTEETIVVEKILERKSTVFYQRQMNPMTHNKLSLILSSVKIYEELKRKVEETRAASDKTLEIKESSPFIDIVPVFPGCICVPAAIPLDARNESARADFDVTPLAPGEIEDACVKLYYEGKVVDIIKTPTRVVKQTAAKISGFFAFLAPIFGPLFEDKIGPTFQSVLPFWDLIGIEGYSLVLSGIAAALSGLFYYLKKRKPAEPITSNFPTLDEILQANK